MHEVAARKAMMALAVLGTAATFGGLYAQLDSRSTSQSATQCALPGFVPAVNQLDGSELDVAAVDQSADTHSAVVAGWCRQVREQPWNVRLRRAGCSSSPCSRRRTP